MINKNHRQKKRCGGIAPAVLNQERRYSKSATAKTPAAKTVAIEKPEAAVGVTGGCVISAVIPGDAAGVASMVSSEDTGSTVVASGAAVVSTGVGVLSGVGVAAGALEEDSSEPDDGRADVGVCRGSMLPFSTISKLNAINCASLHWGS